jgi:ketosteroid isomerase-like protein
MKPALLTPDEAEAAFYSAFSSADIEAMKQVWADSPHAVCIHPMSAPLYGHDAIIESWAGILSKGGGRISHQTLYRRSEGNLAIHGIEERLLLPQGVEARMHTTHVYAYAPESGWKLLMHHASPLPAPGKGKPESVLH